MLASKAMMPVVLTKVVGMVGDGKSLVCSAGYWPKALCEGSNLTFLEIRNTHEVAYQD